MHLGTYNGEGPFQKHLRFMDTVRAKGIPYKPFKTVPAGVIASWRKVTNCTAFSGTKLTLSSSNLLVVSGLGASLGRRDLRCVCCENATPVVRMSLSCKPLVAMLEKSSGVILTSSQQVGLAEGTFYPAVHTVLGSW